MSTPTEEVIAKLHHLFTKLKTEQVANFDVDKVSNVLTLYSEKELTFLKLTLNKLSLLDIDIIAHLFDFRNSEFDISPDPFVPSSPRNSLVPSLLFSILRDTSSMWPILSLNLTDCKLIPKEHIVEFTKKCLHLQELILSGCTQLQDNQALDLLSSSPNLTRLTSLGMARTELSGDTLVRWVMANSDLTKLDLSKNNKFSNFHFEQLARGALKLREVNLSDLENIEGLALVSFLRTHNDIRKLQLDRCGKFRATNFIQLKTHLQNVEEFSIIRNTPLLCDLTIVLHFIAMHAKLAYFNITNWQGTARNLTENYEGMPNFREVPATVVIQRQDITFPVKISSDVIQEYLSEIRAAYEEKKILLLLDE